MAELRAELNSDKKDKNFARKKIALKKIVANMTMSNNDMAALFPDVIQCMKIPTLEIKKMCVCFPGAPGALSSCRRKREEEGKIKGRGRGGGKGKGRGGGRRGRVVEGPPNTVLIPPTPTGVSSSSSTTAA